jgi:hypothetical protein
MIFCKLGAPEAGRQPSDAGPNRPGKSAHAVDLDLNSNNGYTLFDDGVKVLSVENRLVLFDCTRLHTGASCTDADDRLVLNINMMLASGSAR